MKILRKILSFIVTFIFLIGLIGFGGLFLASRFLKENYYTEILDKVDIKKINVGDLGIKELEEEYGKDVTIEEVIVSSLEKEGINGQLVTKIIESAEVKEITGRLFKGYVDYKVKDEGIPQISKEDINRLLENTDVKKIMEEKDIVVDKNELLNQINDFIISSVKGGF